MQNYKKNKKTKLSIDHVTDGTNLPQNRYVNTERMTFLLCPIKR